MLLSELITELQYRVEDDSDNSRFPEDQKINAINNAYYTLLAIVSDKDLNKFRLTKSTYAFTPDRTLPYSISSVDTSDPILRIANAYDVINFKECKIVSKDELFSSGPNYKYGILLAVSREYVSDADKFILYANPSETARLHLWSNQSVSNLGVNNEYPITEALKPTILGMAESELWRSDNDPTRAKEAYAEAINILQAQEGK
tara:strand:+ start:603 stop:1211 length:609 start_codon:yes stop_codon:yes gene_type:complete